jgi:hypothetical protein
MTACFVAGMAFVAGPVLLASANVISPFTPLTGVPIYTLESDGSLVWEGFFTAEVQTVPGAELAVPVFRNNFTAATLYRPMAGCLLTDTKANDLSTAANASSPGAGIAIDRWFACVTPNGLAATTTNRLIRFDLTNLPGYAPGDSLFDLDAKNGTSLASACGLFTRVGTTITCGRRDHDTEFIQSALAGVDGRSQIFRSELAALSWNLLQLLVITSCNEVVDHKSKDRSCFDAETRAFRTRGCSLAAPHLCRNVTLLAGLTTDPDGDGIESTRDNCTLAFNPSQADGDGDDFGNACDADLDGDGESTGRDFILFRTCFAPEGNDQTYSHACDLAPDIPDGVIDAADAAKFRELFSAPPGPSGLR